MNSLFKIYTPLPHLQFSPQAQLLQWQFGLLHPFLVSFIIKYLRIIRFTKIKDRCRLHFM